MHASGTGSSVVGLSGAFSAVALSNLRPTLDQTQFAFAENRQLFVIDYDGRNERALTGVRNGDITRISYSSGGGILYFCDGDGLWSVFSNGGTPTLIGPGLVTASVSPDGTKRLWKGPGAEGILYSNLDGSNAQKIPGSDNWTEPHWFDANHVIVLEGQTWRVRGLSGGFNTISSSQFVAGGRFTRQMLFSTFNSVQSVFDIGNYTLPFGNPLSGWTFGTYANTGNLSMSIGAFSPNGREFVAFDNNGEGSAASGYYLRRRNVDTMAILGTVRIGTRYQTTRTAIAWQPFVTSRVVAGAITYTVTRGSGKPTFRREGSLRVFEGTIQGVFDAKGKNLLPQGASQVKLDVNGRVVSSR